MNILLLGLMKLVMAAAIVFGAYFVFGIDFVYSEGNVLLELLDINNEGKGVIFEKNGFLTLPPYLQPV